MTKLGWKIILLPQLWIKEFLKISLSILVTVVNINSSSYSYLFLWRKQYRGHSLGPNLGISNLSKLSQAKGLGEQKLNSRFGN